MKNQYKAALIVSGILAGPALAEDKGVSFSHKDWEVACDNTLTCRAAGYTPEPDPVGSVLITRKAGANTSSIGRVILADADTDEGIAGAKLSLWVNDQFLGMLKADGEDKWQLSDSQVKALINAFKGTGKVEFKGGPQQFVLSTDGAYAVLLKMDDVQGRTGTPGALTKKGDKPESSVYQPIPPPVIQAVKVRKAESRALASAELAALKPRLLATLKSDDYCERFQSPDADNSEGDETTLTPLDDRHALISTLCWRAAYNEGYGFWVIDRALKENPILVTDSGTDYSEGVISLSQKGRGLGDCMAYASWVWEGSAFRQSDVGTTGMCRYIRLGGTWDLPTFVSDVKASNINSVLPENPAAKVIKER